MPDDSPFRALQELVRARTDFIVVGGLAAVLNGAPVTTFDLDIVFSQEPANLDRLLIALESLDAAFRIQPDRRLKPAMSHLQGKGHLNLLTTHGPLDLLATIGSGLTWSDLLPASTEMDIGDGVTVRVLNLETIIAIKEQLSTDKDLATLPILRHTLRERQKK